MVRTGLEIVLAEGGKRLRGRRVGLLTNQAGVTLHLERNIEALMAAGVRLTALFSPEHGLYGEWSKEDIPSGTDARSGLPLWSLYGAVRRPTPEMLAEVDVLVVDLQDIGSRYYTLASTLGETMAAANAVGKGVMVLDRPNPIGGVELDGNVLDRRFRSFVGCAAIPARHGLTLGEMARWLTSEEGITCPLEVVPMAGWRRSMVWDDTGLPWVAPSPNATSPRMALLYPGTCLIEGTNLSEGRGTPFPFEWIGAPWIDPFAYADALNALRLSGVAFRPLYSVPSASKHAGQRCGGVQVHITKADSFRPVATGFALLEVARSLDPEHFQWRCGKEHCTIDLLCGTDTVRRVIDASVGPVFDELEAQWTTDRAAFHRESQRHLIYA